MSLTFSSETDLEEALSRPTDAVIETLRNVEGDLVLLGVAGKMGPTLARMARRAWDAVGKKNRVIGVARFSAGGQNELHAQGIETIGCDLLDERQVTQLPEASHVVMMTGMKFGTAGNSSMTWAVNDYAPMLMASHYRKSSIVAFSTGNVYGLTTPESGGSVETDDLAPVGEYAMSALGRERLLEHFSRAWSIPMAILRLNYACDLRYGVLVDIASKVSNGQPVDVSMGYLNTIWQGDANAMTLCAFGLLKSPPHVLNMTGPEVLSQREVALTFGRMFERAVTIVGEEAPTALLNNAHYGYTQWGNPTVTSAELIEAVADWTRRGGRLLGKPTHFEARDGKF